MAGLFGVAQDIFGAAGSLLSGFSEASGSRAAAGYYRNAAAIAKQETGLKLLAAGRQIYQTLGQARADIGASGIKLSGSAADVMRSSAAQGAITKAVIGEEGQIQQESFLAQAQAAEDAAKAQEGGGILGALGGLAKLFI